MQKRTLSYLIGNIREFEDLRVDLERKVQAQKLLPKKRSKRLDDNSLDIIYQKIFASVCTKTDSYAIRPKLEVNDIVDKHKKLFSEYWPWVVGVMGPDLAINAGIGSLKYAAPAYIGLFTSWVMQDDIKMTGHDRWELRSRKTASFVPELIESIITHMHMTKFQYEILASPLHQAHKKVTSNYLCSTHTTENNPVNLKSNQLMLAQLDDAFDFLIENRYNSNTQTTAPTSIATAALYVAQQDDPQTIANFMNHKLPF